jgi:hypothetical protein
MYGLKRTLKKSEIDEKRPSGAKAPIHSAGSMRGLKPPPPSETTFSTSSETSSEVHTLKNRVLIKIRFC